MEIEFERRYAPSRPFRSGTRRRRAPQARVVSEAGASWPRKRPASLDTDNQLATSDRDWLQSTLTEADLYRQQMALHRELLSTYLKIFQQYAGDAEAHDKWWAEYARIRNRQGDEDEKQRWTRIDKWVKDNVAPTSDTAKAIHWEKKWRRLQHCQMEWVGYAADCCKGRSRPIAVPIGCNDRLCPLCAWNRSRRARVKIKQMYDRIPLPVMITLTIPNLKSIQKGHIHHFRKMVRAWLAQNSSRIEGGIYSVETTFNRNESTWHLHAHILASMTTPLPKVEDAKVDFFGQKVMPFVKAKWEWEFDWLNLGKDRWAKMPNPKQPARKRKKWASDWEDYRFAFKQWVLQCRAHSTKWAKVKNGRKFELRRDLSQREYDKYFELEKWNAKNRRIFHIEPVTDRDGAVCEVLKYLTKSAQFSDMPAAVEQFAAAVASARMVQTFGSWYGFEVETKFDPEHLDDWGKRECACGLNVWSKLGIFFKRDVELDDSGRWFLKRPFDHNSGGTVPRPTIRALDVHKGEDDSYGIAGRDGTEGGA